MFAARLSALRAELARQGLHGFIIPRADEHLGEYVPAAAERLAWLTGFSGSAGLAAVLADRAAIFTDGRYVLQLATETDPALWERRHITEQPPPSWLAGHAPAGARIGYDPLLISEEALQHYLDAGLAMAPVAANPVDAVWADRPAPPCSPARPHPLAQAGRASADKRAELAAALREAGQDAAILSDPASIAWLLNIRGADLPYMPVALGFAILHADGGTELFMADKKLPDATRAWLGDAVTVQDRAALPFALARLAGRRVRVDPVTAPVWFAQSLREAGATVIAGMDPCLLPKACKNAAEQQGARDAHARDGVALCRFLHWLDGAAGHTTELDAAARLLGFRAESPAFRGESFPAISAAGEHGAIIHYRVTPASNRPINPDEVLSDRFRRSVRRRHHRCHPHRLDRSRRCAGGIARAGDARAQGPYRDCHAGVSARLGRPASRRLRPRGAVARGSRLRPWHRPWRRQLPLGA